MEFRYYYATHDDDSPIWGGEVAHIKIKGKSTTFLCGAEKPDNYEVKIQALPGRKLCPECVRERNRLIDGRPTLEQIATWWYGGQAAHKRELEILDEGSNYKELTNEIPSR